jgi:hypothetical protein
VQFPLVALGNVRADGNFRIISTSSSLVVCPLEVQAGFREVAGLNME